MSASTGRVALDCKPRCRRFRVFFLTNVRKALDDLLLSTFAVVDEMRDRHASQKSNRAVDCRRPPRIVAMVADRSTWRSCYGKDAAMAKDESERSRDFRGDDCVRGFIIVGQRLEVKVQIYTAIFLLTIDGRVWSWNTDANDHEIYLKFLFRNRGGTNVIMTEFEVNKMPEMRKRVLDEMVDIDLKLPIL
jgi:hypothetical protein